MPPHKNITRIFAALSAANEAILRTNSEKELFQRVCDAAVAEGELFGAAALLVDADASMQVVAGAGYQIDKLRDYKLSADEKDERGLGLAATAFRTDRTAFTNDYA